YLTRLAPYASDVMLFFRGHGGHRASSEELNQALIAEGSKSDNVRSVNYTVAFIDYIIANHFSEPDDSGIPHPLVTNPLIKITRSQNPSETVRTPLPYRYIQQLREILCPYRTDQRQQGATPWIGHHFKDWTWAIDNSIGDRGGGWMNVDRSVIDHNDPDCVWRMREPLRNGKKVEVYEIWSPVIAMFLFIKLHLPLRSYQVRFLDSGEADTWRYDQGRWVKNQHRFHYGTDKRSYAKGVFKRVYDSFSESYSTGLYITTNKTADQNKNEIDRGYTIPWQHDELLYWLEKLRNWQEKYNPIIGPTLTTELEVVHFGRQISAKQKQAMGEFCFLLRDAGANKNKNRNKPITNESLRSSWYQLLAQLECNLAASGQALRDGSPLKLVRDYPVGTDKQHLIETMFPLHSLRVSLITCYTMDTQLPLPVISKLLAGHSRLLMTIYYTKITPSVMAEKMEDAHSALEEKSKESLRLFLKDASLSQIQAKAVYNNGDSLAAALANRNPIGWEPRSCGLCLVGGNTVRSDEPGAVGGCWNGGEQINDVKSYSARIYGSVSHGPENCPRCRWFVTDASYLPELNAQFNQVSYKAHQAASLAVKIEGELHALRDDEYFSVEKGRPFTRQAELQQLERRYEKQRVEADEYAKDYIAVFNLIHRIVEIENGRGDGDDGQKLIAVGKIEDLAVSMKFIETSSELLHLSLLCDDAEVYPDLLDDLRKTPAIYDRSIALSRMLLKKGYKPVLMEMHKDGQLIAANALMRKMALIAHPTDKMEGYRIAANYIEAEQYMKDDGLLKAALGELRGTKHIKLSGGKLMPFKPKELE
ncbi:MAG: VPA1269 family protein, partial [Lentisphaerota bacterium]